MKIVPVPLLKIQRDLYEIADPWDRFRRYVRVMTGEKDDLVLPLAPFNPMGKGSTVATLDALLDMEAEEILEKAARDAATRLLCGSEGTMRVGLVVADDLEGSWTHRQLTEVRHRFGPHGEAKRGWATVLCWTSEEPEAELVYQETLMSIYRHLHAARFGWPDTLRQMLEQEGRAACFAGLDNPTLSEGDLLRAGDTLAPHLETNHFPTLFACLYGDDASLGVGFEPQGLPPRAGFAFARELARRSPVRPEAVLGSL